MKEMQKLPQERIDLVNVLAMCAISLIGCIDVIRYIRLGNGVALATICIIEMVFFITAYIAWKSRLSCLNLSIAIVGCVLLFTMNNFETTMFNAAFLVQASAGAASSVTGTIIAVRHKTKLNRLPAAAVTAGALILLTAAGIWQFNTITARHSKSAANADVWAVPVRYEEGACTQEGTVETITYQTKAYATDQRQVEKTACVYLPWGYEEDKQYNILYLLHGTGDDEEYWLKTFPENKAMIDRLIAYGDIEPLIIVTPTFYVENDCEGSLDPLTYSFQQELRNDLMPAAESRYSTYAKSCDAKGFEESRDHRAFAGLSRGAVTTYHSVLCGSLDWFSWFGTFSGSRTEAEYFKKTLQSESFVQYPINYLYVSSGSFDFALPGQIRDYQALLETEPRLKTGVNTDFDVYPMRYHSIGSWHLALYNYLQRIFTS